VTDCFRFQFHPGQCPDRRLPDRLLQWRILQAVWLQPGRGDAEVEHVQLHVRRPDRQGYHPETGGRLWEPETRAGGDTSVQEKQWVVHSLFVFFCMFVVFSTPFYPHWLGCMAAVSSPTSVPGFTITSILHRKPQTASSNIQLSWTTVPDLALRLVSTITEKVCRFR